MQPLYCFTLKNILLLQKSHIFRTTYMIYNCGPVNYVTLVSLPITQVRASAVLLLQILENSNLQRWGVVEWYNVHTKFRENVSADSKCKVGGHATTKTHTG
jgi:hypothetical protein